MQKGKIKKLIRDRGFGFISTADEKEVFFHRSGLVDIQYDALNEGQEVEFEVENSPKGARAINVTIAK
jgi:CspA family cold shock protein